MCMLTQEWILEQHGLDGEKHKMRIKYLFYKIVISKQKQKIFHNRKAMILNHLLI